MDRLCWIVIALIYLQYVVSVLSPSHMLIGGDSRRLCLRLIETAHRVLSIALSSLQVFDFILLLLISGHVSHDASVSLREMWYPHGRVVVLIVVVLLDLSSLDPRRRPIPGLGCRITLSLCCLQDCGGCFNGSILNEVSDLPQLVPPGAFTRRHHVLLFILIGRRHASSVHVL